MPEIYSLTIQTDFQYDLPQVFTSDQAVKIHPHIPTLFRVSAESRNTCSPPTGFKLVLIGKEPPWVVYCILAYPRGHGTGIFIYLHECLIFHGKCR